MSDATLAGFRLPSLRPILEREERAPGSLDWLESMAPARLCPPRVRLVRLRSLVRAVNSMEPSIRTLDSVRFSAAVGELRDKLQTCGLRPPLVCHAFALIREAARRSTGLRHYDVQLMGGLALLEGMIAEIETGDGKTLTATLAAATAAMAGRAVHVVTVNDYLAERDAGITAPIYEMLGLSVGLVIHARTPRQRREAYSCPITYCTNKEVVFDYLRDRIALGHVTGNLRLKLEALVVPTPRCERLVMRGLDFAIVDEVDSVLVDEARTPLIISGQQSIGQAEDWPMVALELGRLLVAEVDYRIEREERRIELTQSGKARLAERGEELGGIWRGRIRREDAACQALTALHLFHCDEHYLVRDGKVQIIDEYTGRVMADRSWNEGLHQLMELKEGCAITARKTPVARISYQRFFRRYLSLAGMSGTACEVAGELYGVYRLPVVLIPPFRPVRRRVLPEQVLPTLEEKWNAVVARVRQVIGDGRPVLVGTRSVAASEALSNKLRAAAIEHVVLSAAQDEHEAEIISLAGQPGRVTVATNMAGRGVDIKLAEGIAARGGLHVILTERHEAARIDRQLAGRCGRQGDPGAFEAIISVEDTLVEAFGSMAPQRLRWLARRRSRICLAAVRKAIRIAQRRAETLHSRMRRSLLRHDHHLGTLLGFAGEQE
jgi:preprotein translocase subunit SecA